MKQGLFVIICCLMAMPGLNTAASTADVTPHEQVYVNTDRDLYVAGEKMFFRFWLYNQDDYSGKQSRYAYLALRNEYGVAENVTLKLSENSASGSIYLHDTLSTGMYELVGYTSWMRNLGETSFFRKNVFVANRFDDELQLIDPASAVDDDLSVRFSVEGGYLLPGHPGNILVNTSGRFDTSHRDIHLLNEAQDTILSSQLNSHGFNTISLTPDTATSYTLYIDGTEKAFRLPTIKDQGISLSLNNEAETLKATVFHRGEQQAAGKLSIRHRGNLLWEEAWEAQDSLVTVSLPQDQLPHGVLKVQAHTNDRQHQAVRHWYHKPGDLPALEILAGQEFGRREKVEIGLDPLLGENREARISVSVRRKEAAADDALTLAKQARNKRCARDMEISEYYAKQKLGGINDSLINDFLIGFSSWEEAYQANKKEYIPGYNILMETEGLILSGQVTDPTENTPFNNARVLLNAPDTLVNLMYTHTDDQGRFHFLLSDYHRNKELFLSVDRSTLNNRYSIKVADKFDLQKPFEGSPGRDIWQRRSFIRESQDIVRVQKTFDNDYVKDPTGSFYRYARPPLVYNRPEATVYMDEFMPLDNLREIARELVPVWRFRGSDDDLRTSLVCHNSGNRLPNQPVFFLDGIMIHDFTKLMKLGSREIDKIEIKNVHWAYGDMTFPGIIGIFTENESYQDILEENTTYTTKMHESYRHHKVFNPPLYDEPGNIRTNRPDMRQLLAWEPDLNLLDGQPETYSFFTGDLRGEFLITIEGLSDCGEAIFNTTSITVK